MPEPWEQPEEKPQNPLDDLLAEIRRRGYGRIPKLRLPKNLALYIVGGILLLWGLPTSFYTVEPEEDAVILRFGRYLSTEPPGLHFKLPFGVDQAIKVRTKVILQEEFGFRASGMGDSQVARERGAFEKESLTLTGDLNVADVEWIVQYQIAEPQKYLFHVRDVLKNIRDISQSIIRRVVGDRLVSDVLTVGRVEIASEAQHLTQEILDRYGMGVRIVAFKLQDINPPEPVKPAFNDVNAAKQEQEKVINQAEEFYNKVIPEARGKADQTIQDAEGYAAALLNHAKGDAGRFTAVLKSYRQAPDVTRTRLYLEAMEDLYGRFRDLTIVDQGVKGLLPVFSGAPQESSPASQESKR